MWYSIQEMIEFPAGREECARMDHRERMPKPLESELLSTRTASQTGTSEPPAWLKLGVIAAASALAGGLAAAWWYRNTLAKLQQAEETHGNPDFRISGDPPADEA